jgi:hypothetical protein
MKLIECSSSQRYAGKESREKSGGKGANESKRQGRNAYSQASVTAVATAATFSTLGRAGSVTRQ